MSDKTNLNEIVKIETNNRKAINFTFDIAQMLICIFIVIAIVLTFGLRQVSVDGNSMLDTLHNGDRVFISDFMYTPKSGDIVVINEKNKLNKIIVKRVIATEGQTLKIDYDNNAVYVDGIKINEPYVYSDTNRPSTETEIPSVIPEGYIFVMGDNRSVSLDSRNSNVGLISADEVLGKALFVAWPLNRFTFLD